MKNQERSHSSTTQSGGASQTTGRLRASSQATPAVKAPV